MDKTASNENAYWFEDSGSGNNAIKAQTGNVSVHSDQSTRPASQLFTVRIWSEVSAQGAVSWRGKVQQVPNGAWRYFHEWQALTTFLQTQVAEGATAPSLPPRHSAGSLSG